MHGAGAVEVELGDADATSNGGADMRMAVSESTVVENLTARMSMHG